MSEQPVGERAQIRPRRLLLVGPHRAEGDGVMAERLRGELDVVVPVAGNPRRGARRLASRPTGGDGVRRLRRAREGCAEREDVRGERVAVDLVRHTVQRARARAREGLLFACAVCGENRPTEVRKLGVMIDHVAHIVPVRIRLTTLILTLALLSTFAAQGFAVSSGGLLIYTNDAPAEVLYDGGNDLAPVQGALRQWPARLDERWSPERRVAKIDGDVLAQMTAAQMVRAFRNELTDPEHGGYVGVDEITRTRWSLPAIAALRTALGRLGPDAQRVLMYVGPSLVERVGMSDPRRPLPGQQRALVSALSLAGASYLQLYTSEGPLRKELMARYATRWQGAWPGAPEALRVMFGPSFGMVGLDTQWEWMRGSPAGRQFLSHGVGVWGLKNAAEAEAFLTGYRAFLSAPDAPPPAGDTVFPQPGGIDILLPAPQMRPGQRLHVQMRRDGRAVVRLTPTGGTPRVIAKFPGPGATPVSLPADMRPGRYLIEVFFVGDNLDERVREALTVR